MKDKLPSPKMERNREIITTCPLCESKDLVKDYEREEIYCNNCGLILSDTILTNHHIIPHSPSAEARNGVHKTWIRHEDKGRYNNSETTNYRHNMSNEELMKWGRGRYLRPL